MKKISIFTIFVVTFCISLAQAAPIILYDWAFNVNGMTYEAALGDTLPGDFNDDNFNWDSGIGTLFVTFSPSNSGDYSILGFFDHEIVEDTNLFFNEYAFTTGSPQTGQTWEADEPGFLGDIYYNFLDGQLDNTNGEPKGFPDDVAMAMGWDFYLASDEYAVISFILDETEPGSEFYLKIYHYSNFEPAILF